MSNKVSPLRPEPVTENAVPPVGGVWLSTGAAGVKYQGRDDVMLAELAPGTVIAGVFTQSATRAAPVLDCQSKIGGLSGAAAAFLVNAGNANAFTGKNGADAVTALTAAVSEELGVPAERVFTASTGVIGEPLPKDRISAKLAELSAGLAPGQYVKAAQAIMTTDTYPKVAHATIEHAGKTVNIVGIAKGSGMIAPDMATMLAFIFTDASVSQPALQAKVNTFVETTFNAITVDSDTSTSDTLLVAATGASDVDCTDLPAFDNRLWDVMQDLAMQVVRDGEGASKLVAVQVAGAKDTADAKRAAMAVANSPLVKTAIAGEDPNWGRVVMAVGKSGAHADRDKLGIRFGDIEIARNGWVSPDYREELGAAYMKRDQITIEITLGMGDATFTAWTCDLTHDYISINADYRS